MVDLKAMFEKMDDEFLKFDRIVNPPHPRPDLCAFLMLHKLTEGTKESTRDMVGAAEYEQIWLSVDMDMLAARATIDDIRDLSRCGVRYDDNIESLCMSV